MNPVLKRTLTGLTIGAAVIAAILTAPLPVFPWVIGALVVLASAEYAQLLWRKRSELGFVFYLAMLVIGVIIIANGLFPLARIAERGNVMLLYVIAIIKFSDVGGFAFGLTSAKLLKNRGGNHKLCPLISPGKSWEGLFGSLVFSSAVSCAFMPWTGFAVGKAVLLGVIAALTGTVGDLVESKFKRWVGVKDSSAWKITNGMGGFLDMFDSLLIAPSVLMAMF